MKINVALFIAALSTTAAASAGDDGAAPAASATVDRPHLRALQTDDNRLAACSAPVQNGSCDNMFCNNCNQGQTHCTPVDGCMTNNGLSSSVADCGGLWEGVACCNAGKTKCYDPHGSIPETSLFIQSDEEEEEEKKVPQDTTTTTTDKLGDEIEAVVPSSSTLRASSSSLLKVAGCPSPYLEGDVDAACSLDCSDCSSGKTTCTIKDPLSNGGPTILGKWHICCNGGGTQCYGNCDGCVAQADEEDAVMIKDDKDKLDASSPLRASLLKVE